MICIYIIFLYLFHCCITASYIYKKLLTLFQFKTQCFCGNVEPSSPYRNTSGKECNMACGGNSNKICGGEWRLSIYKGIKSRFQKKKTTFLHFNAH